MQIEIITNEDLQIFKRELFAEIRKLVKSKTVNLEEREWLKSYEVRKLLGISPGTLQNLRINGTLEFTQVGGLIYYKYEDIIKMMNANKHKNPLSTRDVYLQNPKKKWE